MAFRQDYSFEQLEIGYETGADRLLLWLPMVVTHVIDDDSPLANWRDPDTVLSDSDATIVVVVRALEMLHNAYMANLMRHDYALWPHMAGTEPPHGPNDEPHLDSPCLLCLALWLYNARAVQAAWRVHPAHARKQHHWSF